MAVENTNPVHNNEKTSPGVDLLEQFDATRTNLVYDNVDEEPELHARTYIAILAVFLINIVQVFALQGPPAVLSYIAADIDGEAARTWVPNALALPQAVLGPVVSSIADMFQLRKSLIVGFTAISFIGAAIAPGSTDIYRLIAAQTLIGMGFAIVPLEYVIPSEILPRKWRPVAQATVNIGASLGAVAGIVTIGALTKADPAHGWKKFYWIQMALWGAGAIGILVAYRPPKRHTRYDHLSFLQKLRQVDLVGSALLTAGLTLFLAGLNLGGELYSWTNARVLVTMIVGVVSLLSFCLYEWKGTKTGIPNHELFQGGKHNGRTFAICIGLIAVEGVLLFAFAVFYPAVTGILFASDPLITVTRSVPFWICTGVSTFFWGYISAKFRDLRYTMFSGFLIFTAGIAGMASVQPASSTSFVVLSGLAGIGFGAPLILVIAAVQLCTPHNLIATATAVMTSARGVGATIFTVIFQTAALNRAATRIPDELSQAALRAGLPISSVRQFVTALAAGDTKMLSEVPNVTPAIITAGAAALKQAYADSFRVVFIIAAPLGAAACVGCLFLGDLGKTMNYRVDAPVEDLHSKKHHHEGEAGVTVSGTH